MVTLLQLRCGLSPSGPRGQKRVEMRSSDSPPAVEQASPIMVPSILPEPAPDGAVLLSEKLKTQHPAEWPVNPHRPSNSPMFARAVFPCFDLIGPVPMVTEGLCGLAPDFRVTWKKRMKPLPVAGSDQALLLAGALAAISKAGAGQSNIYQSLPIGEKITPERSDAIFVL